MILPREVVVKCYLQHQQDVADWITGWPFLLFVKKIHTWTSCDRINWKNKTFTSSTLEYTFRYKD